ncbi:hypothetical protein R80B4_01906 [Fibrobacteres bacterium R8-0-B4]
MKRFIAAVLPLVAICAASFAQESPAADAPQSYRLTVNFEENSLDLAPLSAAALDSMSAVFAKHSRNHYEVHGYTCPIAEGQKAARLAPQRVERMVEHLMSLGVPGENIVTVVNAPKAAAGTAACADDRRVDIISTGAAWRADELAARLAELQAAASAAESELADNLKAEMAELKRRLAEASAAPTAPAAEPPTAPTTSIGSATATVQPVIAEAGKQAVAVYMAGQEPPAAKGVHTVMGGELARVLSESDKYTAVDRTEAILEQLDKEHVYQRSGAVDDDQIKAIGHQLGVGFLCISNINAVGRKYYLDTRLVDVVTAEIARSVTATSSLKDANEMARVGRNIALELLEAEKTAKARKLRKKIFRYTAIGLDVLGAGALAYGYLENNNVVKHTEVVGVDDYAGLYDHMANGPEAERAATRRNAAYIVGGVLIAAGITIHIVF